MPRKGVKLEIANFKILLCLLLVMVQLVNLTNCSTDKHETWYGKLVVVQVLSGVQKKRTISQHNVSTSQSSSGAQKCVFVF